MPGEDAVRLTVDRQDLDGRLLLVLVGELDPHTAPRLEAELASAGTEPRVVLDLAGVTFLDSAGVRAIVSAHERLSNAGGSLALRSPSPVAARVLEISGLDQHLDVG